MEIEELNLSNYIKIYDNFLPENIHNNYLKYVNSLKDFEPGELSGDSQTEGKTDKKIRDVLVFECVNSDEEKSFTNIHWTNFILAGLTNKIENYFNNFNEYNKLTINTLNILKYNVGGHYKLHSDNCHKFPRSLSFIFLINDGYEGGELFFASPINKNELKIETKKNRLIIWPSNFLYPHAVTPVTKGVRYSIVAWAS